MRTTFPTILLVVVATLGNDNALAKCATDITPETQAAILQRAGSASKQNKSDEQAERNAESALMSNLSSAGPALDSRLREQICVQDGFILLRELLPSAKVRSWWYVMPTNVPWIVSCDLGLSVTLGSWASGDSNSVNTDHTVQLSSIPFEDALCRTLALETGKRLTAILKGQ